MNTNNFGVTQKETILVTFASKYGSTKEVAEAVAAVLRESDYTVDLQPARSVKSLAGYSAVVLGAPFYIGNLLKDAQQFLSKHQETLVRLPVALFTLGPTKNEDFEGTLGQIDATLAKYPWLKPVAVKMFGGKLDPASLRFPDSLLTKLPASPLHGMPFMDIRDWDAIRAWAKTVAAALQQTQAA